MTVSIYFLVYVHWTSSFAQKNLSCVMAVAFTISNCPCSDTHSPRCMPALVQARCPAVLYLTEKIVENWRIV